MDVFWEGHALVAGVTHCLDAVSLVGHHFRRIKPQRRTAGREIEMEID